MLYAAVSPSAAITRAAFSEVARPMTRPPVSSAHSWANTETVCVLPVPAGAVRSVAAASEVSIVTTASAWLSSRPNLATASRAWASVTMTGRLRRASSMIRDSRSSWPVVVYLASFGGR